MALVRERTIPTERPRWSANLVPTFADRGVSRGQRNGSPRPLISGNAISIKYSEYVSVNVFIQFAKRMRHIVLSSVGCPSLPRSYTLSNKRHEFRKKVTDYKMCVFIFSTNFV